MFEMFVKGDGEMRRIGVSASLPAEISDSYRGLFGEITLTVMPLVGTDDPWETIVDLSVDQAAMLRDALSLMIEHLSRNPAGKSRTSPEPNAKGV